MKQDHNRDRSHHSLQILQINGQSYSIYIRPYLISSNLAGAIFLLLLLGVIVFLSSCLADPKRRNLLLSSPLGVVELWVNLFDHPANASKVRISKPHFKPDFELFKRCIVNTLLIAFLYAFMEWVFLRHQAFIHGPPGVE